MSFLQNVAHAFLDGFTPPDAIQTRSLFVEFPSLYDQINLVARRAEGPPWRVAGINEAMGVPAIWGAVTLIANTVGSLSLEAFRQGSRLADDERPRLIIRPNPFSTPRAFFRDSAYYLATRGETWWWVAARDTDGVPLSLYPVPPWEITVEQNPRNRLRPIIRWADRPMPNDDMRQITYMPGSDGRGRGPLQACGAAISAAVESTEWAANFFGGNIPSLIGETEQDMDGNEMAALKEQWLETSDPNLPRFVSNGLKMKMLEFNPEQAQLTESRQASVGDAARMFNMPGTLIEYQMSGQSLHYQNDESIWTDFQRRCLSPHYLEPIEQEISDLLTRATVARFNLKQLLRASPKERAEVHKLNIESGVYTAKVAAQEEGYAPGGVDYAPVPLALPAATPTLLPIQARSQADGFRCSGCHKKLAESAGAGTVIRCRCGTVNAGPDLPAVVTRSEAPQINVHPAPVSVTIEAGAVAAPDMSGLVQAISDLAARNEAPAVTFGAGAIQVDAPDMTGVAEALVAVADRPQPEITVHLPGPTSKRIERDEDGHLIRIVEEPA